MPHKKLTKWCLLWTTSASSIKESNVCVNLCHLWAELNCEKTPKRHFRRAYLTLLLCTFGTREVEVTCNRYAHVYVCQLLMRLVFEDPRSVLCACQECWHFNHLSSVQLVWPTSRRKTGWQVRGGRREQRFGKPLCICDKMTAFIDRAFMSPVKPLASHPPLVLHMTLIPSASPKSSHKHHSTNKSSS